MRRRDFIKVIAGSTAAWPLTAHAQKPSTPVVGLLHGGMADGFAKAQVAGFRSGLAEIGYSEGRNVAIEYRWAESHYERLPDLATDLVRRNVAVIFASTTPAALAAKAATTMIPIVFQFGVDPVKVGVVTSLNRPGGNVTGIANLSPGLMAKRIEMMHAVVPDAKLIAVLVNSAAPAISGLEVDDAQRAQTTLGIHVQLLESSTIEGVELRAAALVIGSDTLFIGRPVEMAALAMRLSLPSIHPHRGFVAAGGLMSYGSDLVDSYRLAGIYTGRILKGEKPADLPVQQSTKVELVLNLKTANALGLIVPLSLLNRADEVIE